MPGRVSGAGSWGFNAAVPPSLRGLLVWWEGIEGKGQAHGGYPFQQQVISPGCRDGSGCSLYLWFYVSKPTQGMWLCTLKHTHTRGKTWEGENYLTWFFLFYISALEWIWRERKREGEREREDWQKSLKYHDIFNALPNPEISLFSVSACLIIYGGQIIWEMPHRAATGSTHTHPNTFAHSGRRGAERDDGRGGRGGGQPGEIKRGRRSVKENMKHRANRMGKKSKFAYAVCARKKKPALIHQCSKNLCSSTFVKCHKNLTPHKRRHSIQQSCSVQGLIT